MAFFTRQPAASPPAMRPAKTAIIYRSEIDFMSRCVLDYPDIETGGELFGFWTPEGVPVVLYAVGPGPKARHRATSFVQDLDYVDHYEVEMCLATRLQHIGQWHSHHQLDLARPSGGDVASMLRGVGKPGFPRMLLCIANCTPIRTTVNAFNFCEVRPEHYVHAAWDIVDMDSPFRAVIDRMYGSRFYEPRAPRASHGEMYTVGGTTLQTEQRREHWLVKSIENVEMMKGMVEDCRIRFGDPSPVTEITDEGEPVISMHGEQLEILLPMGFPENSPVYAVVAGKEMADDDMHNIEAMHSWKSLASLPLDMRFREWIRITNPNSVANTNLTNPNDTAIPKYTAPDFTAPDSVSDSDPNKPIIFI